MEIQLTPRQTQILRAIVNEHHNSAQPVGSRVLYTRYGFGISPATIRSVMNALTEAGYLTQPHTSAGRIPTDRAYRLFVEGAEKGLPSVGEQEKLSRRVAKTESPWEAARALAEQLSEVAGGIGLTLDPAGVQTFNLANTFGQPGFEDPQVAAYLAELLDGAAEWLPKLATKANQVSLRIGQENDDYRAQAVSVVAVKIKRDDYLGYVAIVGPTRMPYRKLMALIEYGVAEVKELHG